jgi:predicted GIY-YIG superfamily endonuclease
MTVYLLHFDSPYQHARHYLGSTTHLPRRLAEHANGRGARLLEVITAAGIRFQLARTWTGDKALERQLKRRHNAPRLCPLCRQAGRPRS